MKRRFSVVADTFYVTGRGLVVIPGPLKDDFPGPAELAVDLKRPDGSLISATLAISWFFQSPPAQEPRWGCVLKGVEKSEVPMGTEIWYEPAG
jgi:hypothetical protein